MSSRSLTIFVRHELDRDRRQELAAAGVAVVVDPEAPACAVALGEADRFEPCPRCAALERHRRTRARALALLFRHRTSRAAL